MTLTQVKVHKVPLELPNTFVPVPENSTARMSLAGLDRPDGENKFYVNSMMADLIRLLSAKRPTWEFRSESIMAECHRFTIHEAGEELGWVRHWGGDDVYEFDSPRLRAKRSRGSSSRTKDTKKAAKVVLGNMSPRTRDEVISANRREVNATVGTLVNRAKYMVNSPYNSLQSGVLSFLDNHWDEFITTLDGSDTPTSNKLREAYYSSQQLAGISEAQANGTGVPVSLYQGKWCVGVPDTHILAPLEELPEHYRRAIALLKLVGDGEFVADVGVRHSETALYVIPPKESSDGQ